jgi:hypothetical protein
MDSDRSGRAWVVLPWLLVLAGVLLSGCGDSNPCSTVCGCVQREYGEGGAECRDGCEDLVAEAHPSQLQAICEDELASEGLYACIDRCEAFSTGGGGSCSCSSSACDFCWCGSESENNCPESWRGTGDGCDCGCQWTDPDC